MRSKRIVLLLLFCIIISGCQSKTYTVTFDTNGGKPINSITLKKGQTIKNIQKPEREGYIFVNWLKNDIEYNLDSPITEDITLKANWTEIPNTPEYHTVIFISENKKEEYQVKDNETIKEIKPGEKENYLFTGWYCGDTLYDFKEKVTKDIILTAKYEINAVTITYELDGGMGLAIETIPKNTTIEIPETPIKKGYKFLKWTLNGKPFSFDTKIKEDITLKATWQLIEYVKVTFDTDGGNNIDTIQIEKYSKINKLPTPVKEGYTFVEWQLNGIKLSEDSKIEEDITLKAIYKEEQ